MNQTAKARVIPDPIIPDPILCGSEMPFTRRHPDQPLHFVKRGEWPRALCGAIVADAWNPNRSDTLGRDRCSACLEVLRNLQQGVN